MAYSPENPAIEKSQEKMRSGIERLSASANEETEAGFVDADGKISMTHFPQFSDEIEADKKLVADSILFWSGATDEAMRSAFIRNYGFEGESDESITRRMLARAERMREKGKEVEDITPVLLKKGFGKDFIIVNTSVYDDYHYGVDSLIVNKKTGRVVGAFDDIHTDEEGRGIKAKEKKILSKVKSGGGKIKYGFTFKDGKFIKTSLQNIPVFYLAFTSAQLKEAVPRIDFSNLDNLNEKEQEIFQTMLEQLSAQVENQLQSNELRSAALRQNIEAFKGTLAELSRK